MNQREIVVLFGVPQQLGEAVGMCAGGEEQIAAANVSPARGRFVILIGIGLLIFFARITQLVWSGLSL
jgi:hypothetical protein